MVSQVITVHPDGTMSGLQVKKGRGVDLRQFGPAKIVRASLIEWSEEHQGWEIVIQDAPGMDVLKGVSVTYRMARVAGLHSKVIGMFGEGRVADFEDENEPLRFADYEDAVEVEIAYLDAWRVAGRC